MLNENEIKMYKRIMQKDNQAIGNIILNLTGCDFCRAVGLRKDDVCKEDNQTCTDFIDNYLRSYGND